MKAGSILKLGAIKDTGCRAYLAVRGGFDVPDYLGSKATFTLGQFGGHAGRTLRVGDVLHLTPAHAADSGEVLPPRWSRRTATPGNRRAVWPARRTGLLHRRRHRDVLFHRLEVHYNSSRTGVRLIGPRPQWARKDGGEAGLHPSNIHDNAYAIGAVDFTGDMPVILGPDGPASAASSVRRPSCRPSCGRWAAAARRHSTLQASLAGRGRAHGGSAGRGD